MIANSFFTRRNCPRLIEKESVRTDKYLLIIQKALIISVVSKLKVEFNYSTIQLQLFNYSTIQLQLFNYSTIQLQLFNYSVIALKLL